MVTPTAIPTALLMCGLLVSTCPTNEDIPDINPEYQDDFYDPRKSEYVQPASARAVANANVERLEKQIMHLNNHIAARNWSEDSGKLRAHYQSVIEELRAEVLRNEKDVNLRQSVPRIGSYDNDTAGQCRTLNETDEFGINAYRPRRSSWDDEDFRAAGELDNNARSCFDEATLFDASGDDLSHPILPTPPSPTAPLHRDKIQGSVSTLDKIVDREMLFGSDPNFNGFLANRAGPSTGVSIASRTTAASSCSQLEGGSDCDVETDSDGEFFCLVRRRPMCFTSEKVISNCRLCFRSQNLKRIEFTSEKA